MVTAVRDEHGDWAHLERTDAMGADNEKSGPWPFFRDGRPTTDDRSAFGHRQADHRLRSLG